MTNRAQTVRTMGEMLLLLQKVERMLAFVLMGMTGAPDCDESKLRAALLRDRETLGNLIIHFRARTVLPENFEAVFAKFLQDRNVFVHDLFMQPWFDLSTIEGRAKVEEFMREIRDAAKIVIRVMVGTVISDSTEAPKDPVAKQYLERVFSRFVATFSGDTGELSPDEYAEKVMNDVNANYAVKRRRA